MCRLIGRDDAGRDHPYRFSRIDDADVDVRTFTYPPKVQYDPDLLFESSMGIFVGDTYPAREIEIHLDPKWATFANFHRWHRTQHVDVRADRVVVKMTVRVCPELTAWVLGFGAEAEVIAPDDLRRNVVRRIAAAKRAYTRR